MLQVTLWLRHRNRMGFSGLSMLLRKGLGDRLYQHDIFSVIERLLIRLGGEVMKARSAV